MINLVGLVQGHGKSGHFLTMLCGTEESAGLDVGPRKNLRSLEGHGALNMLFRVQTPEPIALVSYFALSWWRYSVDRQAFGV